MPQNSAFDEHKDELEHYEQMFGRDRGRLAVSLDRLTNALVLVGQHGVYCTSQRNPTVPGDGPANGGAGIDAREGTRAIGYGRVAESSPEAQPKADALRSWCGFFARALTA